jgi:hypothetical protein
MEELDKRLDEGHRLSITALDLSGLKIGPTDAIKVAAFLPKWCVTSALSPGMIAVHATTVHATWFRVLALIKQLLLDSIVRIVRIVAFGDLIVFERYCRAYIAATSCSPDVWFLELPFVADYRFRHFCAQFGAFEDHFQW